MLAKGCSDDISPRFNLNIFQKPVSSLAIHRNDKWIPEGLMLLQATVPNLPPLAFLLHDVHLAVLVSNM